MNLKHTTLSELQETAIVSARLAGQKAMEEMQNIRVSVKNDTELVTQADSKCQQLIIQQIKQNHPDHGFLAEEGKEGHIHKQMPRGGDNIWWIIDPIDGTNNFSHKMLSFSVSIAVMQNGKIIAAAIYEPATDSMFTAVKGGNARLNDRKITVSTDPVSQFSSISLDSRFGDKTPAWLSKIIKKTRYRNLGTTAMHLAYVARGSFIGSIIYSPKLWDIAAGGFLVECAGGTLTDWQGNAIYPLRIEDYEGGPLKTIASNGKVHKELIEIINTPE